MKHPAAHPETECVGAGGAFIECTAGGIRDAPVSSIDHPRSTVFEGDPGLVDVPKGRIEPVRDRLKRSLLVPFPIG